MVRPSLFRKAHISSWRLLPSRSTDHSSRSEREYSTICLHSNRDDSRPEYRYTSWGSPCINTRVQLWVCGWATGKIYTCTHTSENNTAATTTQKSKIVNNITILYLLNITFLVHWIRLTCMRIECWRTIAEPDCIKTWTIFPNTTIKVHFTNNIKIQATWIRKERPKIKRKVVFNAIF